MIPRKKHVRKKTQPTRATVDKTLILIVAALLIFGLIMIYDATVVLSQNLFGNAYQFVILQLAWIVVGFVGFYIFYSLDLEIIKKLSILFFGLSLFFLAVLALFGVLPCETDFIFAPCINGANRWFHLNPSPFPALPVLGVLSFQPAEFAKFSLVLFLAAMLDKTIKTKSKNEPFFTFLAIASLTSFLIILQPNFSTASLIFVIGSVMYFTSGAKLRPMLIVFPILGTLSVMAMLASTHTRARIKTFFDFTQNADQTSGYHIKQILIALGSGGITGVGFGQSRQKFQYLPEVFADSIFAIIGEELGFIGTTFLVILFGILVYKGFTIAKNTPDLFARLLAVGITSWIGLQFFINVGAMTKLIPLTGMPLPLISYGGSSLVFMLMGLGVLANVSKKVVNS
jgi:cell division protein FtsW